ncbi:MAG: biotin/lipoyl-binding protein, partial [candidate division Zixibacteria bacterium]|nr:biotin/lipoyl-binding protein [candidate division Zixibacteria bacterium]
MKLNRHNYVLYIPAAIVVIALIFLAVKLLAPSKDAITGMVEATEVDVAAKIPGRVDSVLVREGDRVTRGQVLATLTTKEVDAKLEQARGVMEAAKARMEMAQNGARPEEKEAVE